MRCVVSGSLTCEQLWPGHHLGPLNASGLVNTCLIGPSFGQQAGAEQQLSSSSIRAMSSDAEDDDGFSGAFDEEFAHSDDELEQQEQAPPAAAEREVSSSRPKQQQQQQASPAAQQGRACMQQPLLPGTHVLTLRLGPRAHAGTCTAAAAGIRGGVDLGSSRATANAPVPGPSHAAASGSLPCSPCRASAMRALPAAADAARGADPRHVLPVSA